MKRYRRGRVGAVNHGSTCAYCDGVATTVDHFVPFSVSYDNSDENLVPSCGPCNGIAHSKRFVSYEEKRLYILGRIAKRAKLVEVYCPKGCGVTYGRIGEPTTCPDCGEPV